MSSKPCTRLGSATSTARDTRLYRPAIRDAIIATTRANTYRRLRKIGQQFGRYADCIESARLARRVTAAQPHLGPWLGDSADDAG